MANLYTLFKMLILLTSGCTAVLSPPCWPLPGHGCSRYSWAVTLTTSTARNGHHDRTRYMPLFLMMSICGCVTKHCKILFYCSTVTAPYRKATFILLCICFFSSFHKCSAFASVFCFFCFFWFIGLYICEDNDLVPKRFRGLGVRIEDDVVIQEKGGPLILSCDAPKTIPDVERSCAQRWVHWATHKGSIHGRLCRVFNRLVSDDRLRAKAHRGREAYCKTGFTLSKDSEM